MLRRTLATLAVLAACAGAAWAVLAVFSIDRRLDVGTVRVTADAHHEGALDLYVPLVDWGVRFPGAVRRPGTGWRSTCERWIAAPWSGWRAARRQTWTRCATRRRGRSRTGSG